MLNRPAKIFCLACSVLELGFVLNRLPSVLACFTWTSRAYNLNLSAGAGQEELTCAFGVGWCFASCSIGCLTVASVLNSVVPEASLNDRARSIFILPIKQGERCE